MVIILAACVMCCGVPDDRDEFAQYLDNNGNQCDLVITNARIVDGQLTPAYTGDVIVVGDRIVFLGTIDTNSLNFKLHIDANGRILAPGLIDIHTHGDPLEDQPFSNFLAMGVTTIVLGLDGSSPVHSTESVSEYLQQLKQHSTAPNIAFFAGHGSLRQKIKPKGDQPLSRPELQQLGKEVEDAITSGCFGLSTGLEYVPGIYANSEELQTIARATGAANGIIMSHLRSEDDDKLDQSLDELLEQGKFCPVHVSHLKVVYGQDSTRAHDILAKLNSARAKGIKVTADVYPYMASYTGLSIVFPVWAKTPSTFQEALRSRKSELSTYLFERIMSRNGPEATLFASGPFTGKTLAEVAQLSGKPFVDILKNLGPRGASGAYFVMNESIQEILILDSNTMIASDGSPSMRHPRGYGSQARILEKYVRETAKLTLEEAIYKMSALPANTIRIKDRGTIEVGKYADLILFNLDNISEQADYEDPYQLSQGIDLVLINGTLAVDKNQIISHSGRFLRKHLQ